MRLVSKRTAAVTAAALIALGGTAGIAWSYWTTTGGGTGTAPTSVGGTPVTIAQVGTLNAMFPGDGAQDINVTITNPSVDQKAFVGLLTVAITSVTKGGVVAASCSSADYILVQPAGPVNYELAPNQVYPFIAGTLQFRNLPTIQDDCKGAVVNLGFVA